MQLSAVSAISDRNFVITTVESETASNQTACLICKGPFMDLIIHTTCPIERDLHG